VDVWRITLAALRRWYVLLPMLAVTGILVMLSGDRVAPEYEGQAGAMLTPPQAATELANPYGSITQANEALGIVLNSTESRREVMDQGLSPAYELGVASRSTIMQISIRAASPEVAVATGQAVLDLAVQELSTRQTESGLPPEAQITLSVLEPPAVTAIVDTGALRIQAVVGVLGAGLSLLVAVLFDDIIGLWKRTRNRGSRRDPKRGRNEKAATQDAGVAIDEPVEEAALPATDPADDEGTMPEPEPEPERAPRRQRGMPRRRAEPAPATAHGSDGDGNGNGAHAGLTTASPSINGSLINTNEWVWPGGGLAEALEAEPEPQPRRNPFFDPEFTKRQLEKKSKRAGATEPADEESESGTTTSSGAAQRP
jgi:hypothetical protein